MQEVIILVGPPGCGRDEWLAKNYPSAPCVDIRNHWRTPDPTQPMHYIKDSFTQCVSEFKGLLRNAAPRIIVNNTNSRASHRQRYITLAHDYGYQTFIIVFPFDPNTARNLVLKALPSISADALDRTLVIDLVPGIYSILPRIALTDQP